MFFKICSNIFKIYEEEIAKNDSSKMYCLLAILVEL